jgi:hypothetical protein
MEVTIIIVSLLLVFLAIKIFDDQKSLREEKVASYNAFIDSLSTKKTKEQLTETTMETNIEMPIKTRELLIKNLKEMGCETKETPNGNIGFLYQGVYFVAMVEDEIYPVMLYLPQCYVLSSYDIEEFSNIRKIVNEVNKNFYATVYYDVNSESEEILVHIKMLFYFIPQIPDLHGYLSAIFRCLFDADRSFQQAIARE